MAEEFSEYGSSLREIIDSFRPGGAGLEAKAKEAAKEPTGNTSANDGGEMARGLNIPTDQGTPGRFNTMQSGQEPQRTAVGAKEPGSNLPPDARDPAMALAKDLVKSGVKVKETEGGSLSSQIEAVKEKPASKPPDRQQGPERGMDR